jgi:hypothetical protein
MRKSPGHVPWVRALKLEICKEDPPNSILYNLRGSSLNKIRPKSLEHVQEISAWLGHFCTCDLFFLYVNFGEKYHFHEPTLQKPFDQFQCKFNFVQLWSVYFTCFNF